MSYDHRSCERNLSNCVEKPEKVRTSTGFELVIPMRCSDQLSYETTDVGSWSFVSSNEPVKNGCEVIYEMFHILNCRFEMKHFIIISLQYCLYTVNVQVYQYCRIVMYRKKY